MRSSWAPQGSLGPTSRTRLPARLGRLGPVKAVPGEPRSIPPLLRPSNSLCPRSCTVYVYRPRAQVNGREVDSLEPLPPLRHWCWYLALYSGGDMSCVVFQRDAYAVFWSDYQVKRYL